MSDALKPCPNRKCRNGRVVTASQSLDASGLSEAFGECPKCGTRGPMAVGATQAEAKAKARDFWNALPRDGAAAATLDDLARIAYEACVGPRDKHPGLAHFERHSESYRRDWRNAVQAVLAASPGRTEPLRWTAETPRVPGEYRARWISIPQYPRWLTVTAAMIAEATPEFWARSEYAGPIPEPIDADAPTLREEAAAVLVQLDELAVIWGDEGVFRRCRDRLRAALERSDA